MASRRDQKNNKETLESFLQKEQLEVDDHSSEDVPCIGIRHLQVLLYFLVCFIGFGFRIVLSVGIVAMTDPKVNPDPAIPTYPEWTDKNVILSAFFWGYVIPQIFAGWAATRFGAKWFLTGTFAINSLAGLLTPYGAARFGSKGVMLCRAIQGFCQGFIYPSLTQLLSQWVPKEERSRLATFVYAAGTCGSILALYVTGIIAASSYGWPWAFYLYGILGVLWCLLMVFFGYNSPADHPYISLPEKLYIERSLGHTKEKTKYATPWRAILTSGPVWALLISQTGSNYCFWTLLTQIPTYMNYVMKFNIKDNSLLSSLPYITNWLLSFFVGVASDFLVNKGHLSRGVARKLFNSLGLLLPGVFMILLGYTGSDQSTQAVLLLIAGVGSHAFHYAGLSINHMDLSPNHAGTVMGLCNGLSQVSGIIAPLVVQFVITRPTEVIQWRYVFFITTAVNVVAALVFDVFASGNVQPWNELGELESA